MTTAPQGESTKNDTETTNTNAKQFAVLETMSERAKVTEAKGPAIVPQLADSITSFMHNRPDKDTIKQLYDKILCPNNCPGLEPIRVNDDV